MHCWLSSFLPSTQSWSTRVCTWADLRPTENVASTRMATKSTFPAWRCRKHPSWNNWLWRRALSHSAARSPVALPCNNTETHVKLACRNSRCWASWRSKATCALVSSSLMEEKMESSSETSEMLWYTYNSITPILVFFLKFHCRLPKLSEFS